MEIDNKNRKPYTRPQLFVENFMTREYCAPCTNPSVTTLSKWNDSKNYSYIDLNGNGSYQVGERFDPKTGVSTYYSGIPDQVTNGDVGIYYFTLSDGTQNLHALKADDLYADHEADRRNYKLETIATKTIKIVNNAAYVKNNS